MYHSKDPSLLNKLNNKQVTKYENLTPSTHPLCGGAPHSPD